MLQKNWLSRSISIIVLLSLFLSACTTKQTTPTTAPATNVPKDTVPPTPVPPTAVPPTATPPPVTITWHMIPPNPLKDADVARVEKGLSEMLQKKGVNVNLDLVLYDWGTSADKIGTMLGAGETCDLIFTSNWFNNFTEGVGKGYYLPLDDLLAQEAPDVLQKYQAVWDVARAGGKIYAVPNQQLWPRVYTFYIRTAISDKYPIDWEKVGNGIQGLKDVLAWGKTVMKGEPDLVAFTAGGVSGLGTGVGTFNESEVFGYSRIMGNWFPAVVKFDDPARKVLNETEVPYFMELAKIAREYEINKLVQPADLTPEEYTANWKAEKYAGDFWMFGPGMYAPIPQPWCNNCTFDGKKYIGAKFLDTGSIQATMTAICATSKQPKAAMQVLRMAQTDAEFHNGLYYGLEGQDWLWADKATKQIKYAEGVDAAMPPYLTYNWMYGDTFLDYYLGPEMAAADPNKVSIQINATAPPATTLGFVFDPTPVSAEIAQINAVVTEQYGNIVTGRAEDPEAAVAKYQKDLKAAGIDKVIAEIQKQIDAWAAAKK